MNGLGEMLTTVMGGVIIMGTISVAVSNQNAAGIIGTWWKGFGNSINSAQGR